MSLAAAAIALTAAPVPQATGADPAESLLQPAAISAQPTSLGTILVDGKGRTVYEFANDKDGMSACVEAYSANWPFVPAPASLPASLPGVTGTLGTTTRPDGARQLTVAGHPVYTFVGDSAPGQTNGQGINLNGGLWTVVSPADASVANPARPALRHKSPPDPATEAPPHRWRCRRDRAAAQAHHPPVRKAAHTRAARVGELNADASANPKTGPVAFLSSWEQRSVGALTGAVR
jgi:predicted lipoprotein with Yx(FWY)xxD motif